MTHAGRTLVICDGGLASLVCCAIVDARRSAQDYAAAPSDAPAGGATPGAEAPAGESDAAYVMIDSSAEGAPAAAGPSPDLSPDLGPELERDELSRRIDAARRHAARYGLEFVVPATMPAIGEFPPRARPTSPFRVTRDVLLLGAADAAAGLECSRMVWPISGGGSAGACTGATLDVASIAREADRALLISRLVRLDLDADFTIETPLLDLTDRQVADLAIDMDVPAWTCWWWPRKPGERPSAEGERWLAALERAGWTPSARADEPRPSKPHEPPLIEAKPRSRAGARAPEERR